MTSLQAQETIHEQIIKALKKYARIAFGLTLLGVGLILFGIAGLANYDQNLAGPPYFISGIIVGCLELLSALMCVRILQTARDLSRDDLNEGFLTSYISHQIKVSTLSVIVSMLGILMALIGGFSRALSFNQAEGVNKFLASVIVIGCTSAFLLEMYAIYVGKSFGEYFEQEVSSENKLHYRPGQGNGYLHKNLNTYMTSSNRSPRQQTNTSPQQERSLYESIVTNKQQQQTSQEQESAEIIVPDHYTEDDRDVNQPLLPDKNSAVVPDNNSRAQ